MLSIRNSYDDYYNSTDMDDSHTGQLIMIFFTLLLIGSLFTATLVYVRRRRVLRAQKAAGLLPTHNGPYHHRSVSISNANSGRNDAVFVYDDKMNLISSSTSNPNPAAIPEIRITFPDEEHNSSSSSSGASGNGRVVIVHVHDSGSVGMEPVRNGREEDLPPYQRHQDDSQRGFQSIDLQRIGGLKETTTASPLAGRWS